jgi:GTP-dependent dephospho-CoA kinase
MPPADTRSASSKKPTSRSVPTELRSTLAEEYGPVYSGAEVDRHLLALDLFATCGDRVTQRAVELDHLPLVGIVDYKTRRDEPIPRGTFAKLGARRTLRVKNPPGVLTEALRQAVKELIGSGGGLIEVDGEEDLGSLALVESLPAGATVIYGIPGAGASFVRVDAAAKENVRQLLAKMEPRSVHRGD